MHADTDQWVYTIGIGQTEEEAINSALRTLSKQILGQFIAIDDITQSRQDHVSHTISEYKFYSFTHVELEAAQLDAIDHRNGVITVRMKIPTKTMQDIILRSKKKSPTLSIFSQIESSTDQSVFEVLRLALAGLEQALQDNVLSERVKVKERGIETFEQYFHYVISQSLASLRLLVTPTKNPEKTLNLTLIELPSLRFQPNVPLKIGNVEKSTNDQGVVSVSAENLRQNEETSVRVALDIRHLINHGLIASDDLLVDSILPPQSMPAMTKVYFYTHHQETPASVVARIPDIGSLSNFTSPSQFMLQPGAEYTIEIIGSDSNKPINKTFQIPDTASDFYISLPVVEKRYGHVDLMVADQTASITIVGPKGILREMGQVENRRLEAGSYSVTVTRGESEDYERIQDNITVLPGNTLKRQYRAPRDRQFYRFGYELGFTMWHFGREPSKNYKLPGNTTYGEFQTANNVTIKDCTGPIAEARYLFDTANLMIQGHLGYLWCQSDRNQSGVAEVEANINTAGFGGGIYQKWGKNLLWLSSGISTESFSWDQGKSRFSGLPAGSQSNSYPFIEIGGVFGMIKARMTINGDALSPVLSIGFGLHHMNEGYRLPEFTNHY